MTLTIQTLLDLKAGIEATAKQFGASEIRIFGSVARGTAKDGSDVDILVKVERGRSLLDLVGFEQAFSTCRHPEGLRQSSSFIQGGEEEFRANEMVQDAIVRNIEIIGEASKNLSDEIRAMAEDQPWRKIAGMRDKLVHQYFGVDLDLVWETASTILPPFEVGSQSSWRRWR